MTSFMDDLFKTVNLKFGSLLIISGLLRLEVQDQGLLHPGLLARTISNHDSVPGGEKLSRLLSTHGRSSGNSLLEQIRV